MAVWVRVDAEGLPLEPLQAQLAAQPLAAAAQLAAPRSAAAAPALPPAAAAVIPAAAAAPAQPPAAAAAPQGWSARLPTVAVREAYIRVEAPAPLAGVRACARTS